MKYFTDTIEMSIDDTYWEGSYPVESNVMSKTLDKDSYLGIVRTYYSFLAELNKSICLFN